MTPFELLITSKLSCENIGILLGLEVAFWHSLKLTTNMVYHLLSRKWFAIGQKLFGQSYLNFCSKDKNNGQVISSVTKWRKYNPLESNINFAVPSKQHLYAIQKEFLKYIRPGIIEEALNLVANKSGLILMVDSKKVALGLKEDFRGDVNLMGYVEPKVEHLKIRVEAECDFWTTYRTLLSNPMRM